MAWYVLQVVADAMERSVENTALARLT